MSSKEQKRKLIEATQTIQDFCEYHSCEDCPFSSVDWKKIYKCKLQDSMPCKWNLPEEEDCKDE